MRKRFLLFLFITIFVQTYSQEKATVFFNDNKTETGFFKIRKRTFANNSSNLVIINTETGNKYKLDDVSKVIVFKDSIKLFYEVINVKTNINNKKSEKKLGLIAYLSQKMKIYFVTETIHSGGGVGIGMTYGSSETYVKKNNDDIAYNMGHIYGAGARGILKRVRDYFSDCPELIKLVEKGKIAKSETLQIVKYYEDNCYK